MAIFWGETSGSFRLKGITCHHIPSGYGQPIPMSPLLQTTLFRSGVFALTLMTVAGG